MPSNPVHGSRPPAVPGTRPGSGPAPGLTRRSRRELLAVAAGWAAPWAVWPGSVEAAFLVKPWPPGKAAPALELSDLDGKPWRLAALKGRPVLLNFWATWCEPCRAEMPSLELLAARHQRDGLVVLSINYREAAPAIRHFLVTLPFSLPILLDGDGAATVEWTQRVFPTTVLIDRGGVPRTTVLGEFDWSGEGAHDLLEPLLAQVRPG